MSERLLRKSEAELYETLYKDSGRADYNLEEILNDKRDCPFLYKSMLKHLNVKESSTLLSFSNQDFFKKNELSYSK